MAEREQLIAWFVLGVAVQVCLLLGRKVWTGKMVGVLVATLLIAVFSVLQSLRDTSINLPMRVLTGLGVFTVSLALVFDDDLLPVVNDRVVLSYTLIFWYAFLSTYPPGSEDRFNWFLVLIWPTATTVLISFTQTPVNTFGNVALYAWFLCTVVGLALVQYRSESLGLFLSDQDVPWVSAGECVMAGMASLYLAVNAFFLFNLVPIPGKTQSWADRMKEWHEFTALLMKKYDGDPPRLQQLAVIVVGEGGVLWLNYRFHWVPVGFLINALIVAPGVVALVRNTPKVPGPVPRG